MVRQTQMRGQAAEGRIHFALLRGHVSRSPLRHQFHPLGRHLTARWLSKSQEEPCHFVTSGHSPAARGKDALLKRGDWRALVNCQLRQLHFTVTQHGQYYE